MLVNIVVAVLLDEFIQSVSNDKKERQDSLVPPLFPLDHKLSCVAEVVCTWFREKERAEEQLQSNAARMFGPLDPILSTLAHYSTSADLTYRITAIYEV